MSEFFLGSFPAEDELLSKFDKTHHKEIPEVNNHIHTPFSFSAFESMPQIFDLAKKEKIGVLGINDFYVADGYPLFHKRAIENKVFPLFNIEFIALLKEEQEKEIRVNDPNNPGRTYFCGKGLKYPFRLDADLNCRLQGIRYESQVQVKEMIDKLNSHLKNIGETPAFKYSSIKSRYARELVRERHIAKAIRDWVFEKCDSGEERLDLLKKLFSGNEVKSSLEDTAALENEIRSRILKSAGVAFVEEDENAFLSLEDTIGIILNAGGIPCYPVLLDNPKGEITEFEADPRILMNELTARNVWCIELIPGRNDLNILKDFVRFFDEQGFVISFGTEHNTPVMQPMKVTTRGGIPLNEELRAISWKGARVIAAHQYRSARGEPGYIDENGKARVSEREEFARLGEAVIRWFLKS